MEIMYYINKKKYVKILNFLYKLLNIQYNIEDNMNSRLKVSLIFCRNKLGKNILKVLVFFNVYFVYFKCFIFEIVNNDCN